MGSAGGGLGGAPVGGGLAGAPVGGGRWQEGRMSGRRIAGLRVLVVNREITFE